MENLLKKVTVLTKKETKRIKAGDDAIINTETDTM